jgi:D-alanine-D-alanine ligase-like ATP-grasp enzyme
MGRRKCSSGEQLKEEVNKIKYKRSKISRQKEMEHRRRTEMSGGGTKVQDKKNNKCGNIREEKEVEEYEMKYTRRPEKAK